MVRHVREKGKRYSHTRAKQRRDPHTTRGPRGHLLVTYSTLQYSCGYSCSEPRIYGFVDLLDSCGPLTRSEWSALRDRHCVPGKELPYGANTCAWVMANPERLDTPLGIERKKGAVIFQSVDLRGR